MSDAPPSLVVSAGLPRSGSTWAANVALACLSRRTQSSNVGLLYADEITDPLVEVWTRSGSLVVKTHFPAASLRLLVWREWTPCILTLRSPHDCILSLMERFGYGFHDALISLRQSIARLQFLLSRTQTLQLRYEEAFTSDSSVVQRIATHLGAQLDEDAAKTILRQFSATEIKNRLEHLQRRGVLRGENAREEIEPETQWHFDHLGDGATGAALIRLQPAQLAAIDHALRDALPLFGYRPLLPPQPLSRDTEIVFSATGTGAVYLGAGFDLVEDWGVWTIAPMASVILPLPALPVQDVVFEIVCRLAPTFTHPPTRCTIIINGQPRLSIHGVANPGAYARWSVILPLESFRQPSIDLTLVTENVRSPSALGLAPDDRPLGLGLVSCIVR